MTNSSTIFDETIHLASSFTTGGGKDVCCDEEELIVDICPYNDESSEFEFQSDCASNSSNDDDDSDYDSDTYYNDGSYTDITVDDYMGELQAWMDQIQVSKKYDIVKSHPHRRHPPPTRVISMPTLYKASSEETMRPMFQTSMSSKALQNDKTQQQPPSAVIHPNPTVLKKTRKEPDESKIENPEDVLKSTFLAKGLNMSDYAPNKEHFLKVTKEHIAAYSKEVTDAARHSDIGSLQKYHHQGKPLQCCNQFGESIIHIVCRRGSLECFKFLTEQAKLSVMVQCDSGRNPLHDAAWSDNPNLELVHALLQVCPGLMLAQDKRGFLPLRYVPRQHWGKWCSFLKQHEDLLLSAVLL